MILLRPGSHVLTLLQLLVVAGEFPAKSLSILGSERALFRMAFDLTTIQDFKSEINNKEYTTKLFLVSGKREMKTIRLCCRSKKGAYLLMPELHPNAASWYDRLFPNNFGGGVRGIDRNHRVAEALALCMAAGIEMRPYMLPELYRLGLGGYGDPTIPGLTGYYSARYLKQLGMEKLHKTQAELEREELKKNQYSRFVGILFYPGGAYIAYNTRNAVMKWGGNGEHKTFLDLSGIIKVNTGKEFNRSAIIFGDNIEKAMETIEESYSLKYTMFAISELYRYVHFVPLNQDGIRLLKILVLPDWKEKLLSVLFNEEDRPTDYGHMDFDAYSNGLYYYSFVDCDIARFRRFADAMQNEKNRFEVVCLPWQEAFVRKTLENRVSLTVISMDEIETALGVDTIEEVGSS